MFDSVQISLPDLLSFAIDRHVQVLARYNRCEAVLAPHSLFERHGELFLRAATLRYAGRPPRETKLGTFKLTGLSNVRLSGDGFGKNIFETAATVRV